MVAPVIWAIASAAAKPLNPCSSVVLFTICVLILPGVLVLSKPLPRAAPRSSGWSLSTTMPATTILSYPISPHLQSRASLNRPTPANLSLPTKLSATIRTPTLCRHHRARLRSTQNLWPSWPTAGRSKRTSLSSRCLSMSLCGRVTKLLWPKSTPCKCLASIIRLVPTPPMATWPCCKMPTVRNCGSTPSMLPLARSMMAIYLRSGMTVAKSAS